MSKAYIAAVVGRGASVVGKSLVAVAAGVTSGVVARVTPLEGCLACLCYISLFSLCHPLSRANDLPLPFPGVCVHQSLCYDVAHRHI